MLPLVAVLLAIWSALAAATTLSAARGLEEAREHLIVAERDLRDVELSPARDRVLHAVEASAGASRKLNSPHVVPFRIVPFVGPNLRAAGMIAESVRDVGTGTAEFLAVAIQAASHGREDIDTVSLAPLAALAAPARDLAATLERTVVAVADLDPEPLVGRLVDARQRFLDVVEPNVAPVTLSADLLDVLPSFWGSQEPRTYLVGAAALSELRGSGGLLGSWSVMTARDGHLAFGEFVDVDELPVPDGAVEAPSSDYERRYARYASLSTWRNANITPDFPSAAEVLMRLYEAGGGSPVDGIIVADAVVFERLAERSGGLQVAGVGFLSPEETLQFVGLDAYAEFEDEDERKRVLGAAATAAFAQLFGVLDGGDIRATADMLADITSGGHLQINVRDVHTQEVLERAGVSGALSSASGESFGIHASNFSQTKLDFFSELEVVHHVRLAAGGVTQATIEAVLHNGAPHEGYPRGVLGPWLDGAESGENVTLLTTSCSRSCAFRDVPDGAATGGTELGRPMVDQLVRLSAGESSEFRYQTTSSDGWRDAEGLAILDVEHLLQPTVNPSRLTVLVDVPRGFEAVELPEGAHIDDDVVIWEGTGPGRVELTFRFSPPQG
jgi:hypothetical protein